MTDKDKKIVEEFKLILAEICKAQLHLRLLAIEKGKKQRDRNTLAAIEEYLGIKKKDEK